MKISSPHLAAISRHWQLRRFFLYILSRLFHLHPTNTKFIWIVTFLLRHFKKHSSHMLAIVAVRARASTFCKTFKIQGNLIPFGSVHPSFDDRGAFHLSIPYSTFIEISPTSRNNHFIKFRPNSFNPKWPVDVYLLHNSYPP
ncbi:hypothetical protein D3C85_1154620 [compost metagenome]